MVYYYYFFIENIGSFILMPAHGMGEAECLGIDIIASFQNSIPIALPLHEHQLSSSLCVFTIDLLGGKHICFPPSTLLKDD